MISKKPGNRRRGFDIDSLGTSDPEKRDILRELLREFDRGVFLVELWRVRKLLEQHCESPPQVRSRAGARNPLFRTLAGLDVDRLKLIHEEMALRRSGKSDLDIISDAILGRTG